MFLLSYCGFGIVVNLLNGRSKAVTPDVIALRKFFMIGLA